MQNKSQTEIGQLVKEIHDEKSHCVHLNATVSEHHVTFYL